LLDHRKAGEIGRAKAQAENAGVALDALGEVLDQHRHMVERGHDHGLFLPLDWRI